MPIGKVNGQGPDVIKPLPRGQVPPWFGQPCTSANVVNTRLTLLGTQLFHKRVARALQYVFGDIAAHNDLAVIDVTDYGGTYNCRPVRPDSVASPHAWAIAIDLNVHAFADGRRAQTNWHCKRSEIAQSLKELAVYFNAWGFSWGGHWNDSYLDPMHFEATEFTCQLVEGGMDTLQPKARDVVADARRALAGSRQLGVRYRQGDRWVEIECKAKLEAGVTRCGLRALAEGLGYEVLDLTPGENKVYIRRPRDD